MTNGFYIRHSTFDIRIFHVPSFSSTMPTTIQRTGLFSSPTVLRAAEPTLRTLDIRGLRVAGTTRILDVVRVIQKRVGASDAVTCYLDRTPAPPPTSYVPVATRDRGAGRPTKRDRRILDRWRSGKL